MDAQPVPIADVSVIVAAFNRAALVTRTLDSIAAQTLRPREVIIVDDASADGTADIACGWKAPAGLAVRVIRHEQNRGVAVARNSGMEVAQSQYLAFLDSDDLWDADMLERLLPPLQRYPDAVLSCADARVEGSLPNLPASLLRPRLVPSDINQLEPSPSLHELRDPVSLLLLTSMIPTCSAVFRRADALAAGLMPDFRTGEDWLFWLKLAYRGRFLCTLDNVATVLRHSSNLTHARNDAFTAQEHLRALIALQDGSLGLTLAPEHQKRIEDAIAEQTGNWRYHLSRLGLRNYWHGLNSAEGRATGGRLAHLAGDPKSVLRALAGSTL